jgi:hypothetical protein
VHRGAALRLQIIATGSDLPAEVFGIACDPLVAACFYDDFDRWNSLARPKRYARQT